MSKNKDIFKYMSELAPLELQMPYDNAGFLVGDREAEVNKALLSLDVTGEVINEALAEHASLIISHHPVIWNALKQVTEEEITQRKIRKLIKNDISVISMHTNLDIAEGGVNDVLIRLLGAEPIEALDEDNCGRVGYLSAGQTELPVFLEICKTKLKANGLRYWDSGRNVNKIAVLGGAGASALEAAYIKGCDTFVTSDIKYDRFLLARELKINLIDADHFCTENPMMYELNRILSEEFKDVHFILSKVHNQTAQFY